MDNEKHYIEKCRLQIEAKVGWGSSAQWQNQDFEALSERIFKETNVTLSVSTLKRIWGKVRYEGSPNLATLNALAQFVGYENWRAFTFNGVPPLAEATPVSIPPAKKSVFATYRWPNVLMITLVVCSVAVLFWSIQRQAKKLRYQNVLFSSKPVTKGVPNTVVFSYDAKDSNADSVFIQQSWDPGRRFKVDKNRTEYTSTYYKPGYFRAKLILDTTIVKEHDIFIESEGWLATVDRQPIPIYVPHQLILRDNVIGIDSSFFAAQRIDLEEENLSTSFFRVVESEAVPSDSFRMQVNVKNTFGKGKAVCRNSAIVLLATDGVIVIPLSIKGCVGELNLRIGEEVIDGKTNNLSAFGVDFSNWAMVQCEVHDKKISISVNGIQAYHGPFNRNIGKVIGVRIVFVGFGEVSDYMLKKI